VLYNWAHCFWQWAWHYLPLIGMRSNQLKPHLGPDILRIWVKCPHHFVAIQQMSDLNKTNWTIPMKVAHTIYVLLLIHSSSQACLLKSSHSPEHQHQPHWEYILQVTYWRGKMAQGLAWTYLMWPQCPHWWGLVAVCDLRTRMIMWKQIWSLTISLGWAMCHNEGSLISTLACWTQL
jgi:hypothetical protein